MTIILGLIAVGVIWVVIVLLETNRQLKRIADAMEKKQ